MGAAPSIRKLSVDAASLLEQLEPSASELQRKRDVRALVQRTLAREWPTCRVLPFGSSESGTGFGGSDVDLGIYFADVRRQNQLTAHERAQILATARARLADVLEVKEFVQHARVPVLKLWDPVRHVACDVSVGGVHALLNTALIRYYGHADPRVRPLAFAVKYWAKQRGINDSVNGTLSSYGFSLLLIFYLQSRQSPVLLPVIHTQFASLPSETSLSSLLQRLHALPAADVQSAPALGTSFQDSVGALLAGFFLFYASEFNWEADVVSVRVGAPLAKATKWSHPVPWRLSIEDPFELAHDVGRVIFHRKGQELLSLEFRRAYEMVCAGRRLDEICAADATSWDASASCYICASSEHKARECGTLSPPKHAGDEGRGGASAATAALAMITTDCWYCGESGHFKAACPMLFFRNIPLHADWSASPAHSAALPALPKSQPIPIPIPTSAGKKSGGAPGGASRSKWERGMSPPVPSKKKKRARQGPAGGGGGASPVLSPPPLPLSPPPLLPKKRRTRRHRQQEPRCALAASSAATSSPSPAGAAAAARMQPRKIDVVA